MTTTTKRADPRGSAFPMPPDVLTDRVRTLADELGDWPSQRRVMRTCRVGAPRADAVLARLRADGYTPHPAPAPTDDPPATTPATSDTAAPPAVDKPEPAPLPDQPDEQVTPVAGTPADTPAEIAAPVLDPAPADTADASPAAPSGDVDTTLSATADTTGDAPAGAPRPKASRAVRVPRWPVWVIAAGAFVAIWGGWVGLGEMVGFGPIRLLPGIADQWVINSAITLPLGMEAYAAYALRAWLAPPEAGLTDRARRFARWSALGALALGAAGQIAYHLMAAAQMTTAPWQITAFVSCLPVIVLGCGAALAHLTHQREEQR